MVLLLKKGGHRDPPLQSIIILITRRGYAFFQKSYAFGAPQFGQAFASAGIGVPQAVQNEGAAASTGAAGASKAGASAAGASNAGAAGSTGA